MWLDGASSKSAFGEGKNESGPFNLKHRISLGAPGHRSAASILAMSCPHPGNCHETDGLHCPLPQGAKHARNQSSTRVRSQAKLLPLEVGHQRMERRLTAILAADVVGYSTLMGEDEVGTLERLKSCRRELIDPSIKEFRGRMVKLMGDGALVEFASVVDAVQCAAAIQRRMAARDQGPSGPRHIRFRIGVNLGDVIVEENDLYGDGVNIAARLEAMAEPGGVCISGTAFDHAVHKVDVGFASLGEQRLKNIADPIRAYRLLLDPAAAGKVVAAPHWPRSRILILASVAALVVAVLAGMFAWQKLSLPSRPSVAVLPFANLDGDQGQDYFVNGITEDLITDLTKLSGLDVIARNSVFAYKDKPAAVADVARDLGVRFVVTGSVRRTGDQIRLNAQLIDAATGDNLWANRFDRGMAGVFAIQDEMSGEIAKALGIRASAAESERMARPPTENLEAYDFYLRAEQTARTGRRNGLPEALTLYDKAEQLDPAFAEAFAADASMTVYIWRESFNDIMQSAPARKRAYEKASRALQLDPDLSSPYAILGIMQVVDRRYEEAIASVERAVALGPGDAETQIALGYVQLFAGNHAEAAEAVETALRLDPNLSTHQPTNCRSGLSHSRKQRQGDRGARTHPQRCAISRRFHDHAWCRLRSRRPPSGCQGGGLRGNGCHVDTGVRFIVRIPAQRCPVP
ncbi:adenylate cyclase [Mesorhizobium sp. URHB0026]